FDHWRDLGCDGWDYDSLLPAMRRAESYERGPSPFRGGTGPQSVSHVHCPHPMTDRFVEAARQAGHTFNPDYNGEVQVGVAYAQASQRRGLRHSTARSYLAPSRRRRNVTVRTHALVTRVLIEGGRAIGVEYRHGNVTSEARCRREVLLSAGSLASPKLLMLSGIGPMDHLEDHGIEVVVDAPGVGQNLQEHPFCAMQFLVNVPTLNAALSFRDLVRHGADFLLRGAGPATSPFAHAVVFGPAEDGTTWPDYQLIFGPFGVVQAGDSTSEGYVHDVHDMRRLPVAAITVAVCALHPRSRGILTLRSARAEDPPVIRHQLLGDAYERRTLVDACRAMRAIVGSDALAPFVVAEQVPGAAVQSDGEWDSYLRQFAIRGQHPVGTCRMGSDDEAVVDPELRVRGVDGLRVVDASVMPTLTSGNTNAPAVMIGERGADLVIGRTMTAPTAGLAARR
ncbi:MAG TPA: GMC oxidoreductase, partial [Acidimicrobiales bacterium]